MIDLGKDWPFGLSRRSALPYLAGFAVLIALLHLLDHPLSVWGTSLPPNVRDVFEWITQWGESGWILYPTFAGWLIAWLLSMATRDNLKRALGELAALVGFIFLGVGLPSLAATLLKRVFGRGRPGTWTADVPLGFQPMNWSAWDYQSFPSGHATTAFSLAAVVAFVWPRALWPAMAFAAAIALSRVVLGAHYPTDITAGGVLGLLGAYGVRALFASRGWLFEAANGRTARRPFVAMLALFRS